jgi:hypothetical protein
MEAVTQASSPAGAWMHLQFGNSLEGVMLICVAVAVVLAFTFYLSYAVIEPQDNVAWRRRHDR